MNGQPSFPPPPGAGGVPAQQAPVVDPPKVEVEKKGGFLSSVYARIKGVVTTVASKVSSFARWTVFGTLTLVGYATAGVTWAYDRTLRPALSWCERWIPFAGELRYAIRMWAMIMAFLGFVIGVLFAAEAGAGFFGMIGFGLYVTFALLPWIIVTTPAIWLGIAQDLLIISGIAVLAYSITDWVVFGKPFWASLAYRSWPGGVEFLVKRLSKKEHTNPVTGEVLIPATA